MIRSKRF